MTEENEVKPGQVMPPIPGDGETRILGFLMAVLQSRGGIAIVKHKDIIDLADNVSGTDDVSIGFQQLPEGMLLINLFGSKEIEAWVKGQMINRRTEGPGPHQNPGEDTSEATPSTD